MNEPKFPIKFSLIQKLVASYSAIALFTLTALVFSISGLYSITRTAKDIARHDLLVISSTLQLRESLVAQERASGKYAKMCIRDSIKADHKLLLRVGHL